MIVTDFKKGIENLESAVRREDEAEIESILEKLYLLRFHDHKHLHHDMWDRLFVLLLALLQSKRHGSGARHYLFVCLHNEYGPPWENREQGLRLKHENLERRIEQLLPVFDGIVPGNDDAFLRFIDDIVFSEELSASAGFRCVRDWLEKLVRREDLSEEEARSAMEFIMSGEATPAQIGAYITALRMKGETVDEITGSARAMRAMAVTLEVRGPAVALESDGLNQAEETVVDTCGTGGDNANTFNISTAVAFVAAGQGLTVAKHGNRAISSRCGSADVLERLGVNLKLTPEQVKQCIAEVGIGFLFAPLYHLAMKHAIGPRREIGVRTIFNLLGPLANPARANAQVLGVYEPELVEKMAEVLLRLGLKRAMVVHGHGTLDEFSLFGPSRVAEVTAGGVKGYTVTPDDFGLPLAKPAELDGGDAERNAAILREIFDNTAGPKLNAVLMNAAAVFKVTGQAADFRQGVELARDSIASGRARAKLQQLIAVSNRIAANP